MSPAHPVPQLRFAHGVASFDPTPDGVLLWTRLVGASALRWTISTAVDEGPVASGVVHPSMEDDWCVTVPIDGLAAATSYLYWFEAPDGTLSPVGRTRTLPGAGADELRVAVVCCSDVSMGWFNGYRAIADTELDLVLHVGDAIYETPKGDVRDPGSRRQPAVTVDDYRHRHAVTREDPDLQALHQRHPMVFVWDDHDVADNAWRHGAKEHDPKEQGPFERRLQAAARARQEWLPARLADPTDRLDMHRSFAVGDLAEVIVLDTRIPGRDEHADHPQSRALDDPERSLLGDEQRAWATERLADRTRPWALLVTAVTLSPLKLPIADDDIPELDDALPSGYALVDGEAMCTDEWDGYPAERDHILTAVRARGGGTVIVSGDIHSAWALEVHDDQGPLAAELVCPSLTSKPMGRQLPIGTRRLADEIAGLMPHSRWSDLLANGWLHLSVTPERVRADWFAVPCHEPVAGTGEVESRVLSSWELSPDLPTELRPASDPLPVWPDRELVPPAWLPPPPRAARRRWWRVASGAAGLAALVALLLVARRRASR